ncbi:MAG TPA: pitrilysin family protein [Myxococcales bacterium]|nr:pitrilysin family protein [Myxococcales bacterium]
MLRRVVPFVVVALCALPVRAAGPQMKFEKYRLPNGLKVILTEDHRLPQVSVNVSYHVGAANQTPGRSGFAHLFEHMMFTPTQHAKDPDAVLESIGASGVNGLTSYDRTNYLETVPANELPTALWLESERMAFLLPTLDAKKLRIQRNVVSNEWRERYENSPYGLAVLRICDLLYPTPHPYYHCVIGNLDEIQEATLDDVRDFFRRYYGPNNASLALVGDFDPAVARSLIEKYFGDVPRGPDVPKPKIPQPMLTKVVRERIEDKVARLPRLDVVWNGLRRYSDDEAPIDVLMAVLAVGRTSRLYRSMILDREVASSVDASNYAWRLGGWIQITATALPGHSNEEMRTLIQAAIDDVKRNGVTADEVERAKMKIIVGKMRSLEGCAARADLMNDYEMMLGDPGYMPQDMARYRGVTPQSVQEVARRLLPDGKRIELEIEPAEAGRRYEASRRVPTPKQDDE